VLAETDLLEGQTKPKYCGVRIIHQAFVYFRENLPRQVPELSGLARKINQLTFVQIVVGSQSDAFTLFESLNNRGVPLSAIDIIKNKLLAEMERQHKVEIDDSFDRWQRIIAALPDVSEQERFLRHFYNAFKQRESVRVDKVTRATKSQIIRIYETLVKRDALNTFTELTGKAALYGMLLRPPDTFDAFVARDLIELQRIGAALPIRSSCSCSRSPVRNFSREIFLPLRLICSADIMSAGISRTAPRRGTSMQLQLN
jgi:hypothetical protein